MSLNVSSPVLTSIGLASLKETAEAIRESQWIPSCPTIKQLEFLALPHREALFGGAAGGGKSEALLMAALMGVDYSGYKALLLRRTYPDLALPGAIMDRARDWLAGTAAVWNDRDKTFTFPSGAELVFGYMEHDNHKYRYQGAEFQFVGFDELTQFPEPQYRYLFSRLRRKEGVRVPVRMRAASNPGGLGHSWVFNRFVKDGGDPYKIFVPALLEDNPHLDTGEYEEGLRMLSEIEYQQLRQGLWVEDTGDAIFHRDDFERYDATDPAHKHAAAGRYIFVDTAFKEGTENDFTAWSVYHLSSDYRLKLAEVGAERLAFPDLMRRMEEVAMRHNQDGKLRGVIIEDKGSGTSLLQTLRGTGGWLGRYLKPFDPKGKKTERARQAAVWVRQGCVLLPHPSEAVHWLHDLEDELYRFPNVEHDDRTDSVVMGVLYLRRYLEQGLAFRRSQGIGAA